MTELQFLRAIGERDEWQRCAEEIFRAAVNVEQERDSYRRAFNCAKELLARHDGECERIAGERDESDAVVSMLSACLLDAEREVEEQAAEIVALKNERDALEDNDAVMLARWIARHDAMLARALDAEEAAADYHAAWQDAEARCACHGGGHCPQSKRLRAERDQLQQDFNDCNEDREEACRGWAEACQVRDAALERVRELQDRLREVESRQFGRHWNELAATRAERDLLKAECDRTEAERDDALDVRDTAMLYVTRMKEWAREANDERDDANRALSLERAAHQVTAGRLERIRVELCEHLCHMADDEWLLGAMERVWG
jgi:hypothetical protein